MYCPKCGKVIANDSVYCEYCGTKVDQPETSAPAERPMMPYRQAVKVCFRKYATFSGRASRAEYWWFYLLYFILYILAFAVDYGLIGMYTSVFTRIVALAFMLPMLAAGVRRLHDTNHSGWWILCPIYNIVLLCYGSDPGANDYGTLEDESA